jgi:uncharacterized membrane protein
MNSSVPLSTFTVIAVFSAVIVPEEGDREREEYVAKTEAEQRRKKSPTKGSIQILVKFLLRQFIDSFILAYTIIYCIKKILLSIAKKTSLH